MTQAYDGNGNRVRKEEYLRGQPQSTQYQYDSQDRLTRESRDKSSTIYRYDAAGNRIQKEQDGTVETYLYDSRNRLLERTERTKKVRYAYDAAGNLTQEQHEKINTGGQTEQAEKIRYAYDTFGRTTEVSGSTFQQKNRYDAEGFRYERKENEKASRFVYHRGMMLAELDETNQVTGSQYFGNGYIGGYLSERKEESIRNSQSDKKASISKETGKGFSSGSGVDFISKERELCYYIRDEQGSVRYVVDQSGNVVNEYQYSAFGETERAEERYENRLCYNGQLYDGLTEQYCLRARYYQPKTGRFTQEDLLYEDGLNLYAYCKSNPVMYCDPSGLAKKSPCEPKVQAEGDLETLRKIYDENGNRIPYGFASLDDYDNFVNELKKNLPEGTEIYFQGSSVTGVGHKSGLPFDYNRKSDFDIGLVNDDKFLEALDSGYRMKTQPNRIGPMSKEQISDLGLLEAQKVASNLSNRDVNFMLFEDTLQALKRPSIKAN